MNLKKTGVIASCGWIAIAIYILSSRNASPISTTSGINIRRTANRERIIGSAINRKRTVFVIRAICRRKNVVPKIRRIRSNNATCGHSSRRIFEVNPVVIPFAAIVSQVSENFIVVDLADFLREIVWVIHRHVAIRRIVLVDADFVCQGYHLKVFNVEWFRFFRSPFALTYVVSVRQTVTVNLRFVFQPFR